MGQNSPVIDVCEACMRTGTFKMFICTAQYSFKEHEITSVNISVNDFQIVQDLNLQGLCRCGWLGGGGGGM